MPAGTCPHCQSERTGRSPTGDWCNDCGWSYPGLRCSKCGRDFIKEGHKTPEGEPCAATRSDLRYVG